MSTNQLYFSPNIRQNIRQNINCIPDIVVNRKTCLPHSIITLPGLNHYRREIESEFFLMFPHISCVIVPMIWTLRYLYGWDDFREWFFRIIDPQRNQEQASIDLQVFESWFAQAPKLLMYLDTTRGIPPELIHSGWFQDVPGLNPRLGEFYYTRLFQIPNVYLWIIRNRANPERIRPLLSARNGENPQQVLTFLRDAKIVVT